MDRRVIWIGRIICGLGIFMLGCGHDPASRRPIEVKAQPWSAPSLWSEAQDKLPAQLSLYAAIDVRALRAQASQGSLNAPNAQGRTLWAELGAFFEVQYGLKLLDASAVVFGLDINGEMALWVKGPVDPARLNMRLVMMRGRTVYELKRPGQPSRWLIANLNGKSYVLFSASSLVKAWLDQEAASKAQWVSFSEHPEAIAQLNLRVADDAWAKALGLGLGDDDEVILTGVLKPDGVSLRCQAPATTLGKLEAALVMMRQNSFAQAQKLREAAAASPMSQALGQLAQAHWTERLGSLLTPTRADDALELTLPALWRTEPLPSWAMLSALAWESINHAQEAARTALAARRLADLQDRVEGYVLAHQRQGADKRWICALPESIGATPQQRSCCAAHGGPSDESGQLCRADVSRWSQAGWDQIGFMLSEPDPFVYELERFDQEVILRLRGDADCDNVLSMYVARVRVKPTATGCEVERGPLLWRNTQD